MNNPGEDDGQQAAPMLPGIPWIPLTYDMQIMIDSNSNGLCLIKRDILIIEPMGRRTSVVGEGISPIVTTQLNC